MLYNKIEDEPYFMKNPSWYKITVNNDLSKVDIRLTDKAPKKAIESYREFIKEKEQHLDYRVSVSVF